jgi:eukaryotic-like serine/threonine-protein kinase
MGRRSGERLTPEIAREICERTGGKVTIEGSAAGLGSQYIVGLGWLGGNQLRCIAES